MVLRFSNGIRSCIGFANWNNTKKFKFRTEFHFTSCLCSVYLNFFHFVDIGACFTPASNPFFGKHTHILLRLAIVHNFVRKFVQRCPTVDLLLSAQLQTKFKSYIEDTEMTDCCVFVSNCMGQWGYEQLCTHFNTRNYVAAQRIDDGAGFSALWQA